MCHHVDVAGAYGHGGRETWKDVARGAHVRGRNGDPHSFFFGFQLTHVHSTTTLGHSFANSTFYYLFFFSFLGQLMVLVSPDIHSLFTVCYMRIHLHAY